MGRFGRDADRALPNISQSDLIDFVGQVIVDAFLAPPHVDKINVHIGLVRAEDPIPTMRPEKPATIQ